MRLRRLRQGLHPCRPKAASRRWRRAETGRLARAARTLAAALLLLALPGAGSAAAASGASSSASTSTSSTASAASQPPQLPPLHGRAAAIYSVNAHRFIFTQNGTERLPMASLTKIMTAMVALSAEHDQTDIPMVIPPAVRHVEGEIAYLTPGETYTFGDLLKAMLVESANDAAVAIAVNVAGSVPAFVALMNDEAVRLGLHSTSFINPDGLDAPGHYSSAEDLARLGAAAMKDPVFRSLVDLRRTTIPWPAKHSVRVLDNHNYLLGSFRGANGIKVGYTSGALNCVVGSASVDGQDVIAVDMGELPFWEWRDESALLNYGLAVAPMLPPPPPPRPVVRTGTETAAKAPAVPQRPAPSRAASGRLRWLAAGAAVAVVVLWLLVRARRRAGRRRRLRRRRPLSAAR